MNFLKCDNSETLWNVLDNKLNFVLFVDNSNLCKSYIAELKKLKLTCNCYIIEILNDNMVEEFEVLKIPQLRIYNKGNEIKNIIGSYSLESLENIFYNEKIR